MPLAGAGFQGRNPVCTVVSRLILPVAACFALRSDRDRFGRARVSPSCGKHGETAC